MRTDAAHSPIVQHLAQLGPFVFRQAAETRIVVSHGRTHLNILKSRSGKLLDGSGKILGNAVSHRPCLATDGQSKRIRAQLKRVSAEQTSRSRTRYNICQKFSSRNRSHLGLLIFDIRSLEHAVGAGLAPPACAMSATKQTPFEKIFLLFLTKKLDLFRPFLQRDRK